MLHSKEGGKGPSTRIRAAVAAVLAVGLLASGTLINAASAAKPQQIRILYATAEAD